MDMPTELPAELPTEEYLKPKKTAKDLPGLLRYGLALLFGIIIGAVAGAVVGLCSFLPPFS